MSMCTCIRNVHVLFLLPGEGPTEQAGHCYGTYGLTQWRQERHTPPARPQAARGESGTEVS